MVEWGMGEIAADDGEFPAIAGDIGRFRALAGEYRLFADKT